MLEDLTNIINFYVYTDTNVYHRQHKSAAHSKSLYTVHMVLIELLQL